MMDAAAFIHTLTKVWAVDFSQNLMDSLFHQQFFEASTAALSICPSGDVGLRQL